MAQPNCITCGRFVGLDAQVVSYAQRQYRCSACRSQQQTWSPTIGLSSETNFRAWQPSDLNIVDSLRNISCVAGSPYEVPNV